MIFIKKIIQKPLNLKKKTQVQRIGKKRTSETNIQLTHTHVIYTKLKIGKRPLSITIISE